MIDRNTANGMGLWITFVFALAIVLTLAPASARAAADREVPARPITQAAVNEALDVADAEIQTLAIRENAGTLRTVLSFRGETWTITLHKYSMRSENFQVLVPDELTGEQVPIVPAPPRTYKGTVAELPGADVRASYVDGKLTGGIFLPDADYGFESLKKHGFADAANVYAVYDGAEWLNSSGGICGVTPDMRIGSADDLPSGMARGTGPMAAEIAIDADYHFFQKNGSSAQATIDDVEAVMAGVEARYSVASIEIYYIITTIIVRTELGSNPYTSSNCNTLLCQFRDEWNSGAYDTIQRDAAHLFTGRNPSGCIGIAWIGTMCNVVATSTSCGGGAQNLAYGLSESRFVTFPFNSRTGLTAHEIGHNWSACHCDEFSCTGGGTDGDCDIMCSGAAGCSSAPTTFGFRATAAIVAFKNAAPCLDLVEFQAPTPNPMTWTSPPFATGATSIGMVATSASDATPPVEYYFQAVSGAGGQNDSGWQASNVYVDSGLVINGAYTYRVKARDAAPAQNETLYSDMASATTQAETPNAPTIVSTGASTMDLDVDPAGNPAGTVFAIQCASTTDANWDQMYVDASGNPVAGEVWQTDSTWAVITVNGLALGGVEYCFHVKAKNDEDVETSFSGTACDTTTVATQTVVSGRTCMDHVGQRWCFDLDGGSPEPRWNPTELEFDLTGNVVSVSAAMNCDSGWEADPSISIGAGNNGPNSRLTVTVNALRNIDCCTITFSGDVIDTYDVRTLVGDVNGSGIVNATDKNLVKGAIGRALDSAKFVFDVNTSGSINATDKNLVKGWIGTTQVACP
ncbi:MAG: hypothetical protein GY778_13235 [bacterium]|nr:hypothetical protein [bacterium]